MEHYIEVAKTSDIPAGEGKVVKVSGKDVALFNVNGKFYAIDNTCKHHGGPLGEGFLDGNVVTCPWHGWQYDVTTGNNIVLPAHVRTFKTKVENGKVFVDV